MLGEGSSKKNALVKIFLQVDKGSSVLDYEAR